MKFLLLRTLYSILFILAVHVAPAAVIKGVVIDKKTKEPLIGAVVKVKESSVATSVSLSGTFKLSITEKNTYTLVCSFIGYHSIEKTLTISDDENLQIDFELEENSAELNEVVVTGVLDKTSDEYALHTEKNSESIVNVMSAKTIQLMPDITVANLLQRFSGVSVDRNASGDAQYAIIRGMPQRYNYTLVNGIKIPSPDDKNRYVPMDLFPADLLDRLEVIKALTPSMEGDAAGGAMNMVMKDAPGTFTVNASAATGTNMIAAQHGFSTYSGWQEKAPVQTHPSGYYATPSDFTYKSFQYYNVAPVNQVYNFSIGDRLTKNKKLGAIFAASYQDLYRGANSLFIKPDNATQPPNNLPAFDDILVRQYSNHQKRLGTHLKADYRFNGKNHIKLYGMFVQLEDIQHRHTIDTVLGIGGRVGFGTGDTHILERSKTQKQNIVNVTLQGDHSLNQVFRINWSAVYSKASNSTPDWSEYDIQQGSSSTDVPHLYSFNRYWRINYDQDYTGYLNLYYNKNLSESNHLEISAGGLYRTKNRDCKYYSYQFTPLADANDNLAPFYNEVDRLGPQYWSGGGDGSVVNPNTYTAHEQIAAGYVQGKLLLAQKWEIIGGARAEHTYQDWTTPMSPQSFIGAYGSKAYLDILPSLNVKYRITPTDNIRADYFKSINRPNLFEIVPYDIQGDTYNEVGNSYLKRATIDNIDLRYEKFTKTLDQISFGFFYKHIINPIEQLWHKDTVTSSGNVIGPYNSNSARNFGMELALTKYWGRFGISGNYTYTNSQITTTKQYAAASGVINLNQTRPLQGQSPHIANLSLLYKDVGHGLSFQLAMAYTGTRITYVSPYQNLDYWQQPYFIMDFSLEKNFLKHFSFYLKAQNLLNTPYKVYIHHDATPYMAKMEKVTENGVTTNVNTNVNVLPLQTDPSKILVQREYYGQNFIAGFRFKFSK